MIRGRLIRVGIIGTGWVAADRHYPSLKRDQRVAVTAVFDRDAARALAFARTRGIPQHFSDMQAFLAAGIDAVAICTPPQAHAPAIEASLLAGKHVLVEKPMTLDAHEGQRLSELARSRGLLLCPAHNFLYSRSMRRVDSWLADGSAGSVRFAAGIQTSSWRRRLPGWFGDLPGGLYFDESPHLLYLMRHSLGKLKVDAAWRTTFSEAAESWRLEARLIGDRGNAYLSMWFGAPLSEWAFVLACSNAIIAVDLFRDVAIKLPPERGHGRRDVVGVVANATVQLWSGIARTAASVLGDQQLFGHDRLIRSFVDALGGGRPPTTADDGVRTVELIHEIWRAAEHPR